MNLSNNPQTNQSSTFLVSKKVAILANKQTMVLSMYSINNQSSKQTRKLRRKVLKQDSSYPTNAQASKPSINNTINRLINWSINMQSIHQPSIDWCTGEGSVWKCLIINLFGDWKQTWRYGNIQEKWFIYSLVTKVTMFSYNLLFIEELHLAK